MSLETAPWFIWSPPPLFRDNKNIPIYPRLCSQCLSNTVNLQCTSLTFTHTFCCTSKIQLFRCFEQLFSWVTFHQVLNCSFVKTKPVTLKQQKSCSHSLNIYEINILSHQISMEETRFQNFSVFRLFLEKFRDFWLRKNRRDYILF